MGYEVHHEQPQWVNKTGIWDCKPQKDKWARWNLNGQKKKQKQQQSPSTVLRKTSVSDKIELSEDLTAVFKSCIKISRRPICFAKEGFSETIKVKKSIGYIPEKKLEPTLFKMRVIILDHNEGCWNFCQCQKMGKKCLWVWFRH